MPRLDHEVVGGLADAHDRDLGDVDTEEVRVAEVRLVVALGPEERAAYVALAREALRLAGRDDPVLLEVLAG